MEPFNKLSNLSDVELHIYNYVISNVKKVCTMSIHDLADVTNTSTASILRLCKKYGCSGFSEFKTNLKHDLQKEAFTFQPQLGNNLHDINKFFNETVISPEFLKAIDNAADIIVNKDLILFIGLGSSNVMAEYGALYFSYLFKLTFRVEDITEYPIESFSENLTKYSCMIACSVSGETSEVVEYVKNRYTQGMNLIVITANKDSVLASLADVAISYSFPVSGNMLSNTTSQIPVCYIIELLAQKVQLLITQKNGKETNP